MGSGVHFEHPTEVGLRYHRATQRWSTLPQLLPPVEGGILDDGRVPGACVGSGLGWGVLLRCLIDDSFSVCDVLAAYTQRTI